MMKPLVIRVLELYLGRTLVLGCVSVRRYQRPTRAAATCSGAAVNGRMTPSSPDGCVQEPSADTLSTGVVR
jgi:hypothetical protein